MQAYHYIIDNKPYFLRLVLSLWILIISACQQSDNESWPDKDSNIALTNSAVIEQQITFEQQQRRYLVYVPTTSEIDDDSSNEQTSTPNTEQQDNSNNDNNNIPDSIYPYSKFTDVSNISPKNSADDDSMPLLFVFHGFGMSAEDQLAMADFTSLADQHQFIVVYPQGALLDGAPHWNAALASADNKSSVDDFGFINQLLQQLKQQYAVDSSKVYATGYSNGGFFAFALACLHSQHYAAIATMSSTMLDSTLANCSPSHATSVMLWHDDQDSTISTAGTEGYASIDAVLDYWKTYNQTQQNQSYTHNGVMQQIAGDGIAASEVQLLQSSGQGHVWIDSQINEQSTNELIWQFLSRFSLDL